MTSTSVRNQFLAIVIAITAIVAYNASTYTTPLTLQAAPIRVGDVCHRCEREITDLDLAAEAIGTPGAGVGKFKTIACMLKFVNDSGITLGILVRDLESGRLIRPEFATFVRVTIDPDTGAEDYVAFQRFGAAHAFAARRGTTPMNWNTVQAAERAASSIR